MYGKKDIGVMESNNKRETVEVCLMGGTPLSKRAHIKATTSPTPIMRVKHKTSTMYLTHTNAAHMRVMHNTETTMLHHAPDDQFLRVYVNFWN